MARSSIGLDIGTRAVSLAEVSNGTLTRFGRALLPSGAVEHGEVQDPMAVAAAVSGLWKKLGLAGRSVHVGIANRRVIVRTIEIPAMSREDLASAIRFQAQEHIPIPLDEAVMDYEVLEDISGPNGEALQRVLVVAAERATVEPLLAAVRGANLEPASLELNAYPLVRAFANGHNAPASQTAGAIVDIGAGVTNVVVYNRGKIRFTRILPTFGGDEFTAAVAEHLNVDLQEAESLKRRASEHLKRHALHGVLAPVPAMAGATHGRPHAPVAPSAPVAPIAPSVADTDELAEAFVPGLDTAMDEDHGPESHLSESHAPESQPTYAEPERFVEAPTIEQSPIDRLAGVVRPLVDRLVTEIRGSLDFYAGQSGALPVDHVVLTGGGALLGGIAEQLNASLGVEVTFGEPFKHVPIGSIEVSPEQQAIAEPFMGLAVGLALAGTGA